MIYQSYFGHSDQPRQREAYRGVGTVKADSWAKNLLIAARRLGGRSALFPIRRFVSYPTMLDISCKYITLALMTKTGSAQESSGSQHFDFDALYRGESPGEGMAPMTTPPWDNKAPSESVIAWQTGGWVHGDVLDIGCGLGDNAVYLAKNGHPVTGLDISPP
jgi:SAM-dependent methyltransferase